MVTAMLDALEGDIAIIPHITTYGTDIVFNDYEAVLVVNGRRKRFKTPMGVKDLPIIGNTPDEARSHLMEIIKNTEFYNHFEEA